MNSRAFAASSSIEEQQRYYNEYWSQRSRELNQHEILRLSEIIGAMSLVRADTARLGRRLEICDLGAGWGWLASFLAPLGNVLGVELSDRAVTQARQDFPHVEFVCADVTNWRPDRTFDVVVSSEVIEHVPQKVAFVDTVQSILRPGGWLILTTPNKRVQKEWDRSNGRGQLIEEWCTAAELRQLLNAFQIVDHHTFLFDFSYEGKFRWLSAPKLQSCWRRIRLERAYDFFRDTCQLGLYQLVAAKRL